MGILIRFAVTFVAVFVASQVLPPDYFHITSMQAALIFALVLGAINAVVRPIVMAITCPIQILTLGLSALVINALLLLLASSLVSDVQVGGFVGAFVAALVISLVSWVVSIVVRT